MSTPSKTLRKGEQTRAAILDSALQLAARDGLEGLTIGVLADQMQMSKSGVFAHFGSREDLQLEVIKLYHANFEQEVFYPSLHHPRGLARLQSMFELWVNRVSIEVDSGCIYVSGAVEYDDRPGELRNQLSVMVTTWQKALHRAAVQAIECGDLHADTDPDQLVFEIYGLILALHHDARFLKIAGSFQRAHTGFHRLIQSYGGNPVQSGRPAQHTASLTSSHS